MLKTTSVFADVAGTKRNIGERNAVQAVLRRAERAFASVLGFMSDDRHVITDGQRRTLAREMAQLREKLDKLK